MPSDDPNQSQTVPADLNPKKRKREFSADEADGRPSAKQARSESPFRDAEDLPLSASDAHKVLTILEVTDTDGILDRLFTYPETSSHRVTFRSLLNDAPNHSLRFVRGALSLLLPSASQPRALLATGAANQQRLVDFAQGLFNEISARKASTVIPKRDPSAFSDDEDDAEKSLPVEDRKRKYALVQRLPTGDWWSSATIPRHGDVGLTRSAAKALSTKQAELVSIIPAQPIPVDEMPLFSTLKPNPVPSIKSKEDLKKQSVTLPNRMLPAPKLMDYGVYSTFAPYFDSENTEVGNDQIHQVVHESLQRRKARALRSQMIEKQKRLLAAESATHRPAIEGSMEKSNVDEYAVTALEKDYTMEVDNGGIGAVDTSLSLLSLETAFPSDEILQNLQNVIPQDEAEVLKQAFAALRTEFGISELLEHVAIALDNLVDMQRERLRDSNFVPSDLEREIASELQSSLSLFVTLRPRTSSSPDKSIILSTTILRALHRSLPAEPTSGYRGTLSTQRTTSLRDDTTMYVKATARAQAAAATAAATGGSGQVNGTPRALSTPTPVTPITQTPQYHNPFHGNPNQMHNPMMYGYHHPGYPTPGMGGMPPTTGGAARVMPNLMTAKGVPLTPGGTWHGYGPMPPYMGKAPPMTPVRSNQSFYKQ